MLHFSSSLIQPSISARGEVILIVVCFIRLGREDEDVMDRFAKNRVYVEKRGEETKMGF